MNADGNDNYLDEQISRAIGRDGGEFDFDRWKQEHREQIEIFRSQEESRSTALKPRTPRMMLWKKAAPLAAALLIIASWAACFVLSGRVRELSGEVTDLKTELATARRDVAAARSDNTTTINLYLKEHQDVVARHASLSPAAPQAVQMQIDQDDILYYEPFDGGSKFVHPAIIVRAPSSPREISPPEAPVISNGHTLTLSEARETAGFQLRALPWLDPGYALDQIRRIEGRDALQLLYTDGINSVSLFEQSLDGRRGLEPKDFREYAVYRNIEQAGGTILAWKDEALSYVLIGNTEMSQLMNMAQSISAGK